MAKYKIEIKKSAAKEIVNLPQRDLRSVLEKIQSLAENPRQHGSKKLSGHEKYRVRYGDYRILYLINDNILVVLVVQVGHRKDVYR